MKTKNFDKISQNNTKEEITATNIFKKKHINKNRANTVKKEFLRLQNECYLCGQNLNTSVEFLPQSYFLTEKAQCQNCMTMVRVKHHIIQ